MPVSEGALADGQMPALVARFPARRWRRRMALTMPQL